MQKNNPKALSEHAHPRAFRANKYVYPVLSRRAGGVSVGINLNPGKNCNFACLYCQVDRSQKPLVKSVDLPELLNELRLVLAGLAPNGALWREPEFRALPPEKTKLMDMAFSGDGEPTLFRNFQEAVRRCVAVKEELGLAGLKVVLLTNASGLARPAVENALKFMDRHGGEVWAKLDAGTPQYFALISGTPHPALSPKRRGNKLLFKRILENILRCARKREIIIQSCFVRIKGAGPSAEEIGAYARRLAAIARGGGRIKLVQVCTLARHAAAAPFITSLPNAAVDAIAARVRNETGLPAKAFYGHVR